jgi:hypothetical protein
MRTPKAVPGRPSPTPHPPHTYLLPPVYVLTVPCVMRRSHQLKDKKTQPHHIHCLTQVPETHKSPIGQPRTVLINKDALVLPPPVGFICRVCPCYVSQCKLEAATPRREPFASAARAKAPHRRLGKIHELYS